MSDPDTRPPADSSLGGTPSPAAPGRTATAIDSGLIEEFARSYLKERRSERRWRLALRLAWLALFGALVWSVASQQRHATASSAPHTALIEIRGEISPDGDAGADGLNAALRNAFEDPGAQAVVLRINSPGGSPVQAGLMADEIQRLKAQHGKKLYAVCEELCASAAYYIAAGADEIFVDKASVVGSIGVLMDGFGFTGTMDRLGVERRLLTAGANKGMLDPFSPQTEEHRAHAQALIDQVHRQFIAVVKQGRGKRLKESPETFSGLFWSGESAIEQGLADRYGSLDFVAREVVKAEDVIDYTPKENVAERLAKRFGAAIGAGAVRAMGGVAGIR
jgi:protease-4